MMSRSSVRNLNLALIASSISDAVDEAAKAPAGDGPVVVVMPLADPAAYKIIRTRGPSSKEAVVVQKGPVSEPQIDPAVLAGEMLRHLRTPRSIRPASTAPQQRVMRPAKPRKPVQAPPKVPSRRPPTRRKRERTP